MIKIQELTVLSWETNLETEDKVGQNDHMEMGTLFPF